MRTLVVALTLAACAGAQQAPPPDNRPLFDRLGGQSAISAVVHDFVVKTKADPRISQFFTNTDPVKLEQAMDDHVCAITGGGCTYKGKSMVDAHTNMHLSDADFAAFMDDLTATLAKLKVPKREAMEVIDAFDRLRPQVVGH
ncbi:MAG TPA: group 1 truncated hemoglobin [Kofleriaceae bacterium]|nr:group 1 truncated hemoglobin [Kofleriaceae bacterium]